jgi:hypothetical protein
LLLSSTGVSNNNIYGDLAQTLGNVTLASAAQVTVNAALTQTLGTLSLVSDGNVTATREAVLAQTLGDATLSSAGAVRVNAALTQTLGALSLVADASNRNATLQQTLASLTLVSSVHNESPVIEVPVVPAGGSQYVVRGKRRTAFLGGDEQGVKIEIVGRLVALEERDTFSAHITVEESSEQVAARARLRALRVLLMAA